MISTESQEQIALFEWAEYNKARLPELELMFHIPNGGLRNKITAYRMKKEGVKPGVPDIFLPVPKGKYHGMWIEMKSAKGKVTDNQLSWLRKLDLFGYFTTICYSWEDAKKEIEKYLRLIKV